jgi:hypothetical protein
MNPREINDYCAVYEFWLNFEDCSFLACLINLRDFVGKFRDKVCQPTDNKIVWVGLPSC